MNNYYDYDRNSGMTWVNLLSVGTEYTFEEVSLTGSAHLVFEADQGSTKQRTFMIQKLTGEKSTKSDRFAYFHVGPYQMVVVQQADYYLPLNTHVYPKGALNLPYEVMLYRSGHVIDGYIGGAYDLSIADACITFGPEARSITAPINSNILVWEKVTVMAGGIMDIRGSDDEYEVRIDDLVIAPYGSLLGRRLTIISDAMMISDKGWLSVDDGGYDDNGRGKLSNQQFVFVVNTLLKKY